MKLHAMAVVLLGLGTLPLRAAEPLRLQGRSVTFLQYCSSCHGEDGKGKTDEGKKAGARDLTNQKWQAAVSDARLFGSISRGRDQMPSFVTKLSQEQIRELVREVRLLGGSK